MGTEIPKITETSAHLQAGLGRHVWPSGDGKGGCCWTLIVPVNSLGFVQEIEQS